MLDCIFPAILLKAHVYTKEISVTSIYIAMFAICKSIFDKKKASWSLLVGGVSVLMNTCRVEATINSCLKIINK